MLELELELIQSRDTRVTPENKLRAVAQRAAEVAERRAVFDANNNN